MSKRLTTIDYTVEKYNTLFQAVLSAILKENLIVLADRYAEDDARHSFKAVNPLFTLRSLPTDIKEMDRDLVHCEACLSDRRGFRSRAKNILDIWDKVGRGNSFRLLEKAASAISHTVTCQTSIPTKERYP